MQLALPHASPIGSKLLRRALLAALASAGLAGASRAEVRVVPTPGIYETIQQAVDQSQHGDIIVVQAGSYAGFVIDGLGIAVESAPGALVLLTSSVELRDLPSGRRALLRGLQRATPSAGAGPALIATGCAGEVRVEACVWRGAHALVGTLLPFQSAAPGSSAARIGDCASIVFSACELVGGEGALLEDEDLHPNASAGGHGLLAWSSNVALYTCTLRGGAGGSVFDTTIDPGGDGGSALRAEASTLFASSTSFVGADGGFADCDFFLGICGSHGNGGHGVQLQGSTGRWRACTFAGGFGGTGSDAGAPGLPIDAPPSDFTQLAGPVVKHLASSPVVSGQPAQLQLYGPANAIALIAISPAPAPASFPLSDAGPAWLQLAGTQVQPLGLLIAEGNATFSIATPGGAAALPPGTVVFTQAVFRQLFGPNSNAFYLADPSHVTLLGSAP